MAGPGKKDPKLRFAFAICTRCFRIASLILRFCSIYSVLHMIPEDVGTLNTMTSYDMQDSWVSWIRLRNGQELQDNGYGEAVVLSAGATLCVVRKGVLHSSTLRTSEHC